MKSVERGCIPGSRTYSRVGAGTGLRFGSLAMVSTGNMLVYLLVSEEPGNTILINIFSAFQQLIHCIFHIREDMSLS